MRPALPCLALAFALTSGCLGVPVEPEDSHATHAPGPAAAPAPTATTPRPGAPPPAPANLVHGVPCDEAHEHEAILHWYAKATAAPVGQDLPAAPSVDEGASPFDVPPGVVNARIEVEPGDLLAGEIDLHLLDPAGHQYYAWEHRGATAPGIHAAAMSTTSTASVEVLPPGRHSLEYAFQGLVSTLDLRITGTICTTDPA